MSNFNKFTVRKFVFLKKSFQMKQALLFFLFVTSLSFMACKNPTTPKIVTVDTPQESKIQPVVLGEKAFAKFIIEGMTCAIGCAATIEKNLQKTSGVASATVDFKSKTARVVYDAQLLSLESLSAVVKTTGETYSVSEIERLNSFN